MCDLLPVWGKSIFLGPETPSGVYLKTFTEKNQLDIYQDVTRTHHHDRRTDRQSHFIMLDAMVISIITSPIGLIEYHYY